METLSLLAGGMSSALAPYHFLIMIIGLAMGVVAGISASSAAESAFESHVSTGPTRPSTRSLLPD